MGDTIMMVVNSDIMTERFGSCQYYYLVQDEG